MEGTEVRKILAQNKVNLAWLSERLGISPQAMQSRLNARNVKRVFLLEITNELNQDLFGVVGETDNRDARQPIYDVRISAGYGIDINEGRYKKEGCTMYTPLSHATCVSLLRHVVQFHAHRVPDGCQRVKTDTVTSHLDPRNVATL